MAWDNSLGEHGDPVCTGCDGCSDCDLEDEDRTDPIVPETVADIYRDDPLGQYPESGERGRS